MSIYKSISQISRSAQRGMTLIELLISLFLGAVLSSGIVALYLESKMNYWAEEEMARMQENGRYAINLLKRELSMAGFLAGDLDVSELTPQTVSADCATNWALDPSVTLDFANNHNASTNPVTSNGTGLGCIDGSDIEPLTDVLVIKRSAGEASYKQGSFATAFTPSADEAWYLKRENYGGTKSWNKFASDDLQDPNSPYDPTGVGDELSYWEYYAKIFYIRDYSEVDTDGISTLCMQTLEGDAMEERCIVEGIEEMHIEFGIDSDADGVVNQYVEAPTPAQLRSATVAKIYILVRSLDQISGHEDKKSYVLGRKTVGAKNDAYLRRVFASTVQMRNAILPAG